MLNGKKMINERTIWFFINGGDTHRPAKLAQILQTLTQESWFTGYSILWSSAYYCNIDVDEWHTLDRYFSQVGSLKARCDIGLFRALFTWDAGESCKPDGWISDPNSNKMATASRFLWLITPKSHHIQVEKSIKPLYGACCITRTELFVVPPGS